LTWPLENTASPKSTSLPENSARPKRTVLPENSAAPKSTRPPENTPRPKRMVLGLRARADAGDGETGWRLARLLAERGDLDQAEQILRACAITGNGGGQQLLAQLLTRPGRMKKHSGCTRSA
jgi:TPR repeat protein